jgi:hypothetical protein
MMAMIGLFLFVQSAQAQWTPAKRLTWTSGSSSDPAIAIDSKNNIYAVWAEDKPPTNAELFYKKSTDGGMTWTLSQSLTWNAGYSHMPAIAIDSNNTVHIVWSDNTPGNDEIYYMRRAVWDKTWSAPQRLSFTSGSSSRPTIAIDSFNAIHVVWMDYTPGNYAVYYKKSTNGGGTWSADYRLTFSSGDSIFPVIATDSSKNIHVVWSDNTPGNYELYYVTRAPGSKTWSWPKRLTWTSGPSMSGNIATDSSGNIHIVWADYPSNNYETYYLKSQDGGRTWSKAIRLTWTSGTSYGQAIAIDLSDIIHVAYYERTATNSEIYYQRSTSGGGSWSGAKRLTFTSGDSSSPALATDLSGAIHIIWQDNTPGNLEIYYTKGK